MAELVQIIGVTHNPVLPGILERDPDLEPGTRQALENFHGMRETLAKSEPDALIVIAGDHLNQTFTDNMPAFMIGKAERTWGPFPQEIRSHGLEEYKVAVDADLARFLLHGGMGRDIDFAFSNEFRIDHAFTMPLSYIRPERDIPIVPIFTNVLVPPIATAQRFFDVGVAIRELITAMPSDRRVAVLASGHLANAVGGPNMLRRAATPELPFDVEMSGLLAAGKTDAVIEGANWERLMAEGSGTPGFLDFVLALGVAGGRPATFMELNPTRVTTAAFFITWDEETQGGQSQ